MDETEAREQLVDDIRAWLRDAPPRQDIRAYVRRLPEGVADILREAAVETGYALATEKEAFFTVQQAADFTAKLSPHDQHGYLILFAAYAPESVCQQLQQTHPECHVSLTGRSAYDFANVYLNRWEAAFRLASAPAYLEYSVYARSVLGMLGDALQTKQLSDAAEAVFLTTGEAVEGSRVLTPFELQEHRKFLAGLSFLPGEFIDDLMHPDSLVRRYMFLQVLVELLFFFVSSDLIALKAAPDTLDDKLWDYLYLAEEREMFARLDQDYGEREARARGFDKLYDYLVRVWTVEAVEAEKAGEECLKAIQAQPSAARALWFEALSDFLPECLTAQVILDPLPSASTVESIADVSGQAGVHAEIAKYTDRLPEEKRKLARVFLEQVAAVFAQRNSIQ